MTCIKTQEEATCFAQLPEDAPAGPPAGGANTWGMAGRSDQMQGRTFMQMGVFR